MLTFREFMEVYDSDMYHGWTDYVAYLINGASRYDVKGRKYIGSPMKYYFEDVGLRSARFDFRQVEETHLMENVIYNERICHGYNVDVGIVPIRENIDRKFIRKQPPSTMSWTLSRKS